MLNEMEFSRKIEKALLKVKKIIKENINTDITFDFDSRYYREHIIEDLLEVKNLLKNNDNILDFGCGRGTMTALVSTFTENNVFGIDKMVSEEEGELSFVLPSNLQNRVYSALEKEFNVSFKLYNGVKIPFDDNIFTFVFAHAVIEHIQPECLPDMIDEIKRVLKKNGYLYIAQTPRKQSLKENIAKIFNLGHEFLVDEKELINLLENKNFKIIKKCRTDLLPNLYIMPKKIKFIWEWLYPAMSKIELFFMKTPLSYFSTNVKLIAIKK